jgi:hypothetical protein
LSTSTRFVNFIATNIYYRYYRLRWWHAAGPAETGAIIPRREDFTMATYSTPNSRSAAVTGAGGGLGRDVAVQPCENGLSSVRHRPKRRGHCRGRGRVSGCERPASRILGPTRYWCGSSAPASVRPTRTSAIRVLGPAAGDPPATRRQASWSLWARLSTTWLLRNSICAITIRDSRPNRARSAP